MIDCKQFGFLFVIHVLVLDVTWADNQMPLGKSEACPSIIQRAEWNATKPESVTKLAVDPPPYVVIHHSVTRICTTRDQCSDDIRNIQSFHKSLKWTDIGYNFLIGGDGNIYEGRGWGIHGAHLPRYNDRSIGICLLGNFEEYQPLEVQMQALKNLIACGHATGKITKDYKVIGHRQGIPTLCPGKNLYNIIKTWPEYDPHPQ